MRVYPIFIVGLVYAAGAYALTTKGSQTSTQPIKLEPHDAIVLPSGDDCGIIKETKRIYGGKAALLGEFPWTVVLEYKSADTGDIAGTLCMGTLINKRYVLTSGNCLSNKARIPVNAILGDWNIKVDPDCIGNDCADPVQKIKVQKTIVHEGMSSRKGDNDIGLIRLDKDATFSEFVSPICLPPKNLPLLKDDEYVTVTGWGKTETGRMSDILLKVDLPIVNSKTCSEKVQRNITDTRFCAGGEEGKDSCNGDSGGPALLQYGDDINQARWYQRGIVASGAGCGRAGYPGIYTHVDSYVEWIVKTIKDINAL